MGESRWRPENVEEKEETGKVSDGGMAVREEKTKQGRREEESRLGGRRELVFADSKTRQTRETQFLTRKVERR